MVDQKKFLKLLSNHLESESPIKIQDKLGSKVDWDSLSVLHVIDLFETLSVKDINVEKIHKSKTAKDLYDLIKDEK